MLNVTKLPDLNELFNVGSEWKWYSEEKCRRLGFFPNHLAYSEQQGTFCLAIKRSRKGEDCPLSEVGANYLTNALKNGRKDGKPVHQCLVVQVTYEPNLKHQSVPYRMLGHSTIQETMDRIERYKIYLNENGMYGDFWWIAPFYAGEFGNISDDELALNE